MKFLALLSAAFAALLVVSCATPDAGPPAGTPRYFQTLESMGVAPATMQRIKAGRVLQFADVLELVKRGVPGAEIVAYLKSTRASYNYSQAQVNVLLNAGADSTLVNFVGREAGDFLIDSQNARQQSDLVRNAKWEREMWNDPYFTDPGYWGAAPFPYMWPMGWY